MKWILRTILALVVFVGVIALVGYSLPVGHEASGSADINASPEKVFALIANPNDYKSWWDGADVKSEVVESIAPTKLVTRIVGETQFGGTWTIEITPIPTGSRVTITERGEVYNVVFRALSKFVFGYTSTMDSCLEAMKKRLA
jgi:uncharacterized protein YndB with AHSA1/START domain